MKYFFILGNNPTLSVAEITAIFGVKNIQYQLPYHNLLIMEAEKEFEAEKLILKMGGVIKIGVINKENINNNLIAKESLNLIKPKAGKFKYGISYYGPGKINTKSIAMEIKKNLKEKNISCRWVTSKEKTLSSVVVGQNKLTSKGAEIVLIKNNNTLLIGKTLAVQPYKELSMRDYGRPARDDQSGMLPPKLAQIMINLATTKKDKTILDPFCGSGTIISEAMLMGFNKLIGSDISKKAISDSRKNIEWLIRKQELKNNYLLHNISATEISKKITPNSIDAIITEPFLGPQRGKLDIKKVTRELEELYSKSLKEFKKVLKPKGKIVMLFPVFFGKHYLKPNLSQYNIINPIPEFMAKNNIINLTDRNTIVYGREGQRVWREIITLENK